MLREVLLTSLIQFPAGSESDWNAYKERSVTSTIGPLGRITKQRLVWWRRATLFFSPKGHAFFSLSCQLFFEKAPEGSLQEQYFGGESLMGKHAQLVMGPAGSGKVCVSKFSLVDCNLFLAIS